MTKKQRNSQGFAAAVVLGVVAFIGFFLFSQLSKSQEALRSKAVLSFGALGIMGDSNADEYRADNNRGGSYATTTLNWVEQLVNYRSLNFGRWANWGGFRRTGYEYNFSLSGATTSSGLQAGVHTALGSLVQSGTVPFVFYALGSNDFAWYNSQFGQIYNGQLSGSALNTYIQQSVNNVATAVDTINASHKAKILISLIADMTQSPTARAQFPDSTKLQRVTDAIKKTNDGIRLVASQRGYSVFDVDAVAQKLLGSVDAQGNIIIEGEKFNFLVSGDEPHHAVLSDNIHAGTVFSGIYANEWVTALNAAFGTQISPFTDNELLIHAGIRTASPSPIQSPTPTASTAPTLVPTPTPTTQPTIRPTASPTTQPTASPTIQPTIRSTATPTLTPRPTTTPRVTATPTFAPTATPNPTAAPVDPYAQYCPTYRSFRAFLLRFLSSSQIATWDARCRI